MAVVYWRTIKFQMPFLYNLLLGLVAVAYLPLEGMTEVSAAGTLCFFSSTTRGATPGFIGKSF